MKCIRLIIHQDQANYRKEETINNKMTYPLPPLSTIIGAIHSACKWDYYHEMNLSISGTYEALDQRVYTDNIFFNSTQTDRGTLVKVQNPLIFSNAYIKVAQAKKQGASFEKGNDIEIYNKALLNEWIDLRKERDVLNNEKKDRLGRIKAEKNTLNNLIKNVDKTSPEYNQLKGKLNDIKQLEKDTKEEFEEKIDRVEFQIDLYKTINPSIKRYEVLTNINLIVYIKTSEENMSEIIENIYNMKSIGRSEDFIEVLSCEIVDLENAKEEVHCNTTYSTYVDVDLVKKEQIEPAARIANASSDISHGTIYYITKDYIIENDIRRFNRRKVLYVSDVYIDEDSTEVFIDNVGGDHIVVNFL